MISIMAVIPKRLRWRTLLTNEEDDSEDDFEEAGATDAEASEMQDEEGQH